jgi:hypothetical protein
MGLVWHPYLAEAGEDFETVAFRVEVAGEEADLSLLTTDDEPGEDEEDAERGWSVSHRAKTI